MSEEELTPEEIESVSNAMQGDTPAENGTQASQEPSGTTKISRAQLLQLEQIATAANLPPAELERLMDIKVKVEVVLGQTQMPIEEILKLHPGGIVELDKLAGEPVEILANGRPIARAEIVVIDENFGVKILDIATTNKKLSVAES